MHFVRYSVKISPEKNPPGKYLPGKYHPEEKISSPAEKISPKVGKNPPTLVLRNGGRPRVPAGRQGQGRHGLPPHSDAPSCRLLPHRWSSTSTLRTCLAVSVPHRRAVCAVSCPSSRLRVTWNVFEATVNGGDGTNNYAEGWNNHLQHLMGHQHPSIWRLIEALQADNAEASTKMLRHAVGTLSPKRQTKETRAYQQRLQALCVDFKDGRRSMRHFLRAVGHSIRFAVA